jgi:uncharacterized protein (DUF1697 family)
VAERGREGQGEGEVRYVALLRAVNVGGAKLPMAELRELCAALGWHNVRTYIQSGNVVFDSDLAAGALETALEGAVKRQFDLVRPVIVRSAAQWRVYAAGTPFPLREEQDASRLMLCLSKHPPAADAAERLQQRAAAGEQVRRLGDAIWVYYPEGVGTTKLSPSLFDKAAGSPVTARNWRTVCKLQELLAGS